MAQAARRRVEQPAPASASPPPKGHNQPPAPRVPTPPEVVDLLQASCTELQSRRNEILAGIERFKAKYPAIPDDDIQGKATDFAGRTGAIAGFLKAAEEKRVAEKAPYLAGEKAVDEFFKNLIADVNVGRAVLIERMNVYAKAKESREREAAYKAAQEAADAARAAEEAALATMDPRALETAAEAAQVAEQAAARMGASAAELSRVHGVTTTGSSSLRSTWKFDEAASDLMALCRAVVEGRAPIRYLQFHTTNIGFAIRSEKVRVIEGCVIKEDRSV